MNLSNINANLPQIPSNYGSSSQQVHNNYVTHINSSQQNNQSSSSSSNSTSSNQQPQQSQQSQKQNTSSTSPQYQSQQSWGQYPTTSLGTGITDIIQQQQQQQQQQQRSNYAPTTTTNNTHSTPNSYTAEFYVNDEHQQSLGFGAMSVNSSIINQPHTLQAVSTIQSALNNLNSNSSQLSLIASAPPIPPPTTTTNKIINNNNNNNNNKENIDINSNKNSSSNNNKTSGVDNNNNNNNNNTNSTNFYLAPGSANHGGSYRQTLNPAIYNAYRMSCCNTNNSNNRNGHNHSHNHTSTGTLTGHRINNNKSPIVHVIAETVYRIPNICNNNGLNNNNNITGRITFRKQDRFDKTALYKTELCTNWMLTGSCTYGNKCHFAHGVEDLKPRMRVENYKTQPCCDPAREGCRRCMYGRRCNYCHPGEPIRRPHPTPYYDKDYYNALKRDFGQDNEFPFGIYV